MFFYNLKRKMILSTNQNYSRIPKLYDIEIFETRRKKGIVDL